MTTATQQLPAAPPAKKSAGTWVKPVKTPRKKCGCEYSLLGYALYVCPEHEAAEGGAR
jgi:hypothetical protein